MPSWEKLERCTPARSRKGCDGVRDGEKTKRSRGPEPIVGSGEPNGGGAKKSSKKMRWGGAPQNKKKNKTKKTKKNQAGRGNEIKKQQQKKMASGAW